MAQRDQELTGDPDQLMAHLDAEIVAGSVTASLEHAVDRQIGDARMLVHVYERYSAIGANRLSLCISVLAVGSELAVSVISSGGSQALFWKVNTFGEEAFVDVATRAIDSFVQSRAAGHGPGGHRSYMDDDGR